MTTTETGPEAAAPPPDPNEVRLTINGREVVSTKGELVIAAAQRVGEYIPRFCYHERMSSVGMCRMCLVDIDTGRGPALQPSCMVTVAPGMVVNSVSDSARAAQEGVIELLLANHPLDCPVCDKGGECPLQDQSFSHGPGESRYIEEKRHFEKPIAISDLVLLDRERCILCDRCTRFADEVAGDALIHFSSRGNTTQITTFPDEPFASYFSGNTVQICPVGALTAKPYRFKARPWDLEQTESTCTTCSVGCRTVVQSSHDELLRYQGVDSDPVNWGWLCDRGRFNFEAVNSDERLGVPMVRVGDELQPTTWNAALARAVELINEAKAAGGANSIAVLGGARGTNEDAYAWARLAHDVIGTPHVYPQMADGGQINLLGFDRATITEAANAATVILMAPDLKEELPVLYLRLRDAVQKRRTKVIEFAQKRSGLSGEAWRTIEYHAGGITQAIAAAAADPDIVAQLGKGSVVIIAGRANLAEHPREVCNGVLAALEVAPGAKVLPALRRGNVIGAIEMGMRPGDGGMQALTIADAAASGKIECLVLLGCDPIADYPDTDLARRMMARAPRIIAIDTFLTKSSSAAHVVLPAAAYGEKRGTTTNIEGRVTTVAEKVTPHGTSRPDWMIAAELAELLDGDLGVSSVDELTDAIAANVPGFEAATVAALATARDGVVCRGTLPPATARPATIEERNSYDYRLVVSRKLYDAAIGTAKSPSLAHLRVGLRAASAPARRRAGRLQRWRRCQGHQQASVDGVQGRRRRLGRARLGVGAVQPTRAQHRRADRRDGTGHRRPRGPSDAGARRPPQRPDPRRRSHRAVEGRRRVRPRPGGHDVDGLVRAQGHCRHAEPHRAQQGRPVGHPADARRRHQAVLQGRPDPRAERPLRVQAGPVPLVRPRLPGVERDPVGRRLQPREVGAVVLFNHATRLQLADPPIGVLLLLALSSIGVYGIMLAGWASGSKYPLLGSVHTSAQMVSYEAALGLSLASVILVSGTLSTSGIVAHQSSLSKWSVAATAFVPFVIFLISATAELNRPPFDLVEAEQELVGGFNTEYSSIRFALFFLAEFMNTVTMSGVIVTLFFGGPQPLSIAGNENVLSFLGPFSGTVWFFLKLLVFLYVYVWFRATLPRLRYDQLMNLGWKVMIPVALGWFMLLSLLRIGGDRGWTRLHKTTVGVISLVVLIMAGGLLSLATRVSARNREREGAMF